MALPAMWRHRHRPQKTEYRENPSGILERDHRRLAWTKNEDVVTSEASTGNPVPRDCTPPSSAYARCLPTVTVRIESEDLPELRSLSVVHHHRDDHAKHAHRHCPSVETQQASPNVFPLVVFFTSPIFFWIIVGYWKHYSQNPGIFPLYKRLTFIKQLFTCVRVSSFPNRKAPKNSVICNCQWRNGLRAKGCYFHCTLLNTAAFGSLFFGVVNFRWPVPVVQ